MAISFSLLENVILTEVFCVTMHMSLMLLNRLENLLRMQSQCYGFMHKFHYCCDLVYDRVCDLVLSRKKVAVEFGPYTRSGTVNEHC